MLLSRRKVLTGTLASGLIAGCGAQPQPPATPGPLIVASFSILGSVIDTLTGAKAQVTALVPAGADAHHFDPPPSAVLAVRDAALVAGVGLGFDGWMSQMLQASGRTDTAVLTAEGLDGLISLRGDRFDPHVWCAPQMAVTWVRSIADQLEARLPALKNDIATGREAMLAALAEKVTQASRLAAALAGSGTRIVVAHDSFGYLERELGIEAVAVRGLSNSAERGGAGMAALIDTLKASGARACFPETQSDSAALQELARETGITMGGALYSDSLSGPTGGAPDLPGLLGHNLTVLEHALAA
ncbi:MAG: metal ABC transporter substrate-binding protein [Hyphomonadaceae bacterium]|jgi:zinc/manganese transport system substrate-binding protein|nr:metal ABC transporter substrate-binding protein [Hyphomonadaceae bacterium]